VRVVANNRNIGLIATLNRGLDLAQGKFVARMDADDMSLPRRLETQLAFLLRNPEVGVCGTWFRAVGSDTSRVVRPPCSPDIVAAHAFFYCPLAHPTVMFRREFFERYALRYDPAALHAEDYELWSRALDYFPIANVPEVLLEYRVHDAQISAQSAQVQSQTTDSVRRKFLDQLLPGEKSEDIAWHLRLCRYDVPFDTATLFSARAWLDRLLEANETAGIYSRSAFGNAVGHVWYEIALRVAANEPRARRVYFSRRYGGLSKATLARDAKFLAHAIALR
jgi:glycosyltransferase involved in cell wall biosynthesis